MARIGIPETCYSQELNEFLEVAKHLPTLLTSRSRSEKSVFLKAKSTG
jgi:hypothetical protein